MEKNWARSEVPIRRGAHPAGGETGSKLNELKYATCDSGKIEEASNGTEEKGDARMKLGTKGRLKRSPSIRVMWCSAQKCSSDVNADGKSERRVLLCLRTMSSPKEEATSEISSRFVRKIWVSERGSP